MKAKFRKKKPAPTIPHRPLHKDLHDEKFVTKKKVKIPKKLLKQKKSIEVPLEMGKKILSIAHDNTNEIIYDLNKDTESIESDGEYSHGMSGYVSGSDLSEDEMQDVQTFLPSGSARTGLPSALADIIMGKLGQVASDLPSNSRTVNTLTQQVRDAYTTVGQFLSSFKSGKLPKAFKVIPRLSNWEDILYITNPVEWTSNAMYEATKIFASNFNAIKAERFYRMVLLPTVRKDIQLKKKLNYHYYMALKKALFKPSAWIKGILFPLLTEDCTLKEATIVGSILAKVSLPVAYAAAALIQICALKPWFATNSFFISILINKKYSLPQQALDAIGDHFLSFQTESRTLPILWQKSFLAFVQLVLSSAQKALLNQLLVKQFHHKIGPLIRNELLYVNSADVLAQKIGVCGGIYIWYFHLFKVNVFTSSTSTIFGV
ncbi:bystin protein [Cardiosporidium cionae]|uniref:Bystin protein n=1 Tax=Cardiosporidium cionae TaxID=476202 RepID=A0ABQ7JFM1_9APIC|nr:bystin protein [Cardiosporidium cionae]|eukprot:KAF8822793.1 bystin protein [Cardiosporidium cionae]